MRISEQQQQSMQQSLEDFDFRLIAPPEYDLLLSAAQKNDTNRIETLIAAGVPHSHANAIGQTALHVTCIWGNVGSVEVLIGAGANVNAANKIMGTTPLHTAMHSHKISDDIKYTLVGLLLDAGADAGIEDFNKKAPIDYLEPDNAHFASLNTKHQKGPRDIAQLLMNDVMSGSVVGCIAIPRGR